MPLTKGATAITMLRVENAASLKLSQQSLAACGLPSFQGDDEKIAGLVPIDNPLDTAWKSHPAYGEYVAFALRIDKKSVPGGVLQKHLAGAMEDELAKCRADGGKISKTRKKEIREQVKTRLLSKTEAVPAIHEIAVNTATGVIYVASKSNSIIAQAKEFISRLGEEPGELLMPDDAGTAEAITGFLREIAMNGIKTKDAAIYACGKITVMDPDARLTGQSKSDAEINEIRSAIENGKAVIETGVKIDVGDGEYYTCAIDSGFRISGLKPPRTAPKEGDGDGFEGLFLERMFLIEKCSGILLDAFEGWKKAR